MPHSNLRPTSDVSYQRTLRITIFTFLSSLDYSMSGFRSSVTTYITLRISARSYLVFGIPSTSVQLPTRFSLLRCLTTSHLLSKAHLSTTIFNLTSQLDTLPSKVYAPSVSRRMAFVRKIREVSLTPSKARSSWPTLELTLRRQDPRSPVTRSEC
jgi:hypothetical protein